MSGYHILGTLQNGEAFGATTSRVDTSPPATIGPARTDDEARAASVSAMRALIGVPYIWASKDPEDGLDCSGAVTVAYERGGLAKSGARYRYGSADLRRALDRIDRDDLRPADSVFYGEGGKVSHVMMYMGEGKVAGATGGGPKTKTRADAAERGAYVKERPIDYRKDIIGYGRAPSVRTPLDGSSSTRIATSDSREELIANVGYALGFSAVTLTGLWAAAKLGVWPAGWNAVMGGWSWVAGKASATAKEILY